MRPVYAFLLMLVPGAALACTPPAAIDPNAPPVGKKAVTGTLDNKTIAFVPYSRTAAYTEYHVWALDLLCHAERLRIEILEDGTQDENVQCTDVTFADDSFHCGQRDGSAKSYNYQSGFMRLADDRSGEDDGFTRTHGKKGNQISNKLITYSRGHRR